MPRSRQIAVIMFTDIVGYTALMGKNEPRALQILADNKNIHFRLLKQYGGKFLKEMGDGILATFQNVTDAVYCASTLLKETSNLKDLNLRIGIHLGEVVVDGNELYGDGVNIASRIEGIAKGGQILISETIFNNIKNRPGIQAQFQGEHVLKNVDEPVKVYSINVDVIPEEYIAQSPIAKKRVTLKNPVLITLCILAIVALGYFAVLKPNTTSTSEVQLEKSIAVLPFADMSPEQDQAYLGDGIAEEILNMLGRLEGMKVIARTSSFQFKGKNVDLREVGEKLGVNYVVEGSVRKFGDQLSVTAQLINSKDGSLLWSDNWDRTMYDIITVQDEIASSISDHLQISFGLKRDAETKSTEYIKAYENYLKAEHFHNSAIANFSVSSFDEYISRAETLYMNAIKLDSTLADAHAGLSNLYDTKLVLQPGDSVLIKKNMAAANIAYQLDANSGYANLAKGLAHFNYGEYEKAIQFYIAAIEINPNDALAYSQLGTDLFLLGLLQEGIEILEKALDLDPINTYFLQLRAMFYTYLGKYDNAESDFKEVMEMDESIPFHVVPLNCLKGDITTAEKYFEDLTQIGIEETANNYIQAFLLAAKGDPKALDYEIKGKAYDLERNSPVRRLLGLWDEWYDYMYQELEKDPDMCIYYLLSVEEGQTDIDPAFYDLVLPIRDHPKYSDLLASQRKRYEENLKRFSVRGKL